MHVVHLLSAAIHVYELVIFVEVIFSWLPPRCSENEFRRFIHAITEPVLRPFRRRVAPVAGLDFSPFVVVLLLELASFLLRLMG